MKRALFLTAVIAATPAFATQAILSPPAPLVGGPSADLSEAYDICVSHQRFAPGQPGAAAFLPGFEHCTDIFAAHAAAVQAAKDDAAARAVARSKALLNSSGGK